MAVRLSEQPTKEIACNNCGCVHKYQPTDTLEGGSDGESYRYIKCLHCAAVIKEKTRG